MISRRLDVAAVMRRRYGPIVATKVIARDPFREECVSVDSYLVQDGGRRLVVRWTDNPYFDFLRPFVEETAGAVRVGAIDRVPNGPVNLPATRRKMVITLPRPLGTRRVLDAETVRRLPRDPR